MRAEGGIYKIAFQKSTMVYIGRTKNFTNRFKQHMTHLLKGTHHCERLQAMFDLYGVGQIEFVVLERTPSIQRQMRLERQYIKKYRPTLNTIKYSRPFIENIDYNPKTAAETEKLLKRHRKFLKQYYKNSPQQ